MKRFFAVLVVLMLAGLPLAAQDVNLKDLDPADIDLSKVDVSDVGFYFNGPIEIFIDDLKYGGKTYVAKLDYNGGSTIAVEIPVVKKLGNRPQMVDLSKVNVRPVMDGVILENIIIEGMRYSGKVAPAGGNNLKLVSYNVLGPVDTSDDRIAEYRREVRRQEDELKDQEKELREKDNEITRLRNRISRMGTTVAGVLYPRTLVSGFRAATSRLGDWTSSFGSLSQSDSSQRFAKYLIAQSQSSNRLKYSFHTQARNDGWRGAGLHFLVSGQDTVSGYGLGQSYLVWITRDERAMQTNKTYIQLYKSMDDVRMIQLQSSITDFDITRGVDIDVHVDKSDRRIRVTANGEDVLYYQDDDFISWGSSVAFRTLGRAGFEDFSIQAE